MSGLLIDELTVPDVLARYPKDRLLADLTDRLLPRLAPEPPTSPSRR